MLFAKPRPASPTRRMPRTGQVQRDLVRVQAIADSALWLPVSSDPSLVAREKPLRPVAVMEVTGTNFSLLAEQEQVLLIEGYQSLLRSLAPETTLEILVRRQRADLSEYLEVLKGREEDDRYPLVDRLLARAHRKQVQTITDEHQLFVSHVYLIVPPLASARSTPPFWRRRASAEATREVALSRQTLLTSLETRCTHLGDALTNLGLEGHRLSDHELGQLVHSCMDPSSRADRFPLASSPLEAIGQPCFSRSVREASTSAAFVPVDAKKQGQNVHQEEAPARLGPASKRARRLSWNLIGVRRSESKRPTPEHEEILPVFSSCLADLIAPSAVEEHPESLFVNGAYTRGLAITAFPRETRPGWLMPLLTHDDTIDISFFLRPLNPIYVLRTYRRRKAELQASKKLARKKGWVEDPDNQVAEDDIERLLRQVAARSEVLISVGLYVQVRAADRAALDQATDRLLGVLHSLLVVAQPTTFEHLLAWQSMQPWGTDLLRRRLVLDTASLADSFPFAANAISMPDGVLAGVSRTGEPVMLDYWSPDLDNPHCFLGAVTGAGKSYDRKVNLLRQSLVHPEEQAVIIDPEGEYERLCSSLGGAFVRLAPGSDHHLNPFDLVPQGVSLERYVADRSHGDRLAENVVWLGTLYNLMLSSWGSGGAIPLAPEEKGLLEHATYEAYRRHGITSDASTHGNQPPTLAEVFHILRTGVVGRDEYGLCNRLYRFVEGSLAGTFAPTNVSLNNRLVVFDVRSMTGELRPIGIYLIANFLWSQVLADASHPRALYIDEAWSLIQHPEGGFFLEDFARRARKRYLRLVTITQSPELFLADPHGAAIAGNAAIKILKKQDRTNVRAVASTFGLTRAEQQHLIHMAKPEALLLAGSMHLLLTVAANPLEHRLATSDPRELARFAAEAVPAPTSNDQPIDLVRSSVLGNQSEPPAEEATARAQETEVTEKRHATGLYHAARSTN